MGHDSPAAEEAAAWAIVPVESAAAPATCLSEDSRHLPLPLRCMHLASPLAFPQLLPRMVPCSEAKDMPGRQRAPCRGDGAACRLLTCREPPPSVADLLSTWQQYGLQPVQWPSVFYSNARDVPDKPTVFGGMEFRGEGMAVEGRP